MLNFLIVVSLITWTLQQFVLKMNEVYFVSLRCISVKEPFFSDNLSLKAEGP